MKKTPKFKNHFNSIPDQGKSIKGPSKTIPDQSMTISEIMRRFASGLPVEGAKVSVYDGEDELLPDMAKLDLADRQELLEQTRDNVKSLQSKLRQKQKPGKEFNQDDQSGDDPAVYPMNTKSQTTKQNQNQNKNLDNETPFN